jgi:hypothetical protein
MGCKVGLGLVKLVVCCKVGQKVAKLNVGLQSWLIYCNVGSGVAKLVVVLQSWLGVAMLAEE